MKSQSRSLVIVIILAVSVWFCVFKKYPKHNQTKASATISWDVTGYYYYLPALFIYNDLKHLGFKDSINAKYEPVPYFNQAYKIENGNYVMQYTCGQAISYFPFFIVTHLITKYYLKYPPDGFSKPYQFSVAMASLFFTILGLIFIRKVLLNYFNDTITSITLVTLALTTNYLDYVALDGAMTHNYLFTYYSILIYLTINFYKQPSGKTALFIGLTMGMICLTRPSEIIGCIIPLVWGVNILSKKDIINRFEWIKLHFNKYLIAILSCILIGAIQLMYWKYVSDNWLVYSYRNEGFSWLKPHIIDGIFSYKRGWLTYTPVMIFALLGIYLMSRKSLLRPLISTIIIFVSLFIYIAFAWDIWWYGGSLGQRTMVQSYALLSLPLALFIEYMWSSKYLKIITVSLLVLFCYLNIWWTYQFQWGRYFWAENMNSTYFWTVLGKINFDENDLKLLDNTEGTIYDYSGSEILYINDFEQDSISKTMGESPIQGKISHCVDPSISFTPEFCFKPENTNYQYYRSRATFKCIWRENNDISRFAEFKIMFKDHSNIIKCNAVKLDRFYSNGDTKVFYFDTKTPNLAFDEICIQMVNAGNNNRFLIDEAKVEGLIVSR